MQPDYFERLAAAYVRGRLADSPEAQGAPELFALPLDALDGAALRDLIALGVAQGLRLHRFKRTMGLARVQRVLGALRALAPQQLLDIGSGRGAFLWPLLDAFPQLPVTAVDLLDYRVADMEAVRRGGVDLLEAHQADATALPFPDGSFEVATLLEVLEHIPEPARALAEAARVARRALLLSVPSKPDDNPEHIHLFDEPTLRRLLLEAGARRVNSDYVLNHLIVVATLTDSR
ncbi:MAG: hypothetical protein OHK0022_02690 [Roseiflexaceae bacterium]